MGDEGCKEEGESHGEVSNTNAKGGRDEWDEGEGCDEGCEEGWRGWT